MFSEYYLQSASADVSPPITPSPSPLSGQHAPKFGTVIPNRIFVGGIAANTTEGELKDYFSTYGEVKDTKIIADRAGVSKGYGFVTFEHLEDAERIIKKESDNLVFKDRKLNIGPAIRKQVMPRSCDPNFPPGTVMFTNGVPYTYQNGMAIFHAPEGGYPIHQPQQQSYAATVMMPRTPTHMYMPSQYSSYTSSPQWSTAGAAAQAQWHWAQQGAGQAAVASSPGYVLAAMHSSPELVYAQGPPPPYQAGELAEASLMEGASVEVIPGHYAL